MTAVFSAMGAASLALLLAAALLAGGARADEVTAEPCRARFSKTRVREYPTDGHATALWMYECKIIDLDPNDVANLPNVEKIALHTNAMTNIDVAVFRSAPRLRELYLSYNKLRELSAFGEQSCRSLTKLLLHHNLLTAIRDPGTFSACTKLNHLELESNHLTYIHPKAFSQLTELAYLFLYSNKMTYVTKEMFASNRKLIQLELFDNRLTYLPPDFIMNLKQAGVGLVYFFFDSNPWQCACLLELVADAKRAGVYKYNKSPNAKITHYDGTLPECVYSGRYPCRRLAPSGLLPPAPRTPRGGL